MKFKIPEDKKENFTKATLCITLGTTAGVITYYLFLFFGIDIFGWNLGLIFAPLAAGYVETHYAHKFIGESIGGISAFILFAITVIYGFIIANPTLGFNAITFGSIIVIIQSALPTLINYILLVVILGIISYLLGFFKKITDYVGNILKKFYYQEILKKPMPVELKKNMFYNELKNCDDINNLPFKFLTCNDSLDEQIIQYLGPAIGISSFERKPKLISEDYKKDEREFLIILKEAKDESLRDLYKLIAKKGGNGVVNLKIEYELINPAMGQYQVISHGTAVVLR